MYSCVHLCVYSMYRFQLCTCVYRLRRDAERVGGDGRGDGLLAGGVRRHHRTTAPPRPITPPGSTLSSAAGSTLGSTAGSTLGSTAGSVIGSVIDSGPASIIGSTCGSAVGSSGGRVLGSAGGCGRRGRVRLDWGRAAGDADGHGPPWCVGNVTGRRIALQSTL